jgi:predicted N-acetyltransferase YhbS
VTAERLDAAALRPPEPLSWDHDLDAFDCGVEALNEWLKRRARRNEAEGASRTFVCCAGPRVAGYYSLAAGSVLHPVATSRVRRNMPEPVPVVLLGRLAVDRGWQSRGLGPDLLRDAALRIVAASQSIGVRAILVHAVSEPAKAFYRKHGFRESPIEPMTLMITVEEAQKVLAQL